MFEVKPCPVICMLFFFFLLELAVLLLMSVCISPGVLFFQFRVKRWDLCRLACL